MNEFIQILTDVNLSTKAILELILSIIIYLKFMYDEKSPIRLLVDWADSCLPTPLQIHLKISIWDGYRSGR